MRTPPPPDSRRGKNAACELIRRLPLRWHEGDSPRATEDILESGWFLGADECARVLDTVMTVARSRGTAFGAGWPILRSDTEVVVPGIPAAVGVDGIAVAGIDGEYRLAEDGIHREAVGTEHLTVTMEENDLTTQEPFDLLWFGETERFILRSGTLEIEDLFSACRVPASPSLLEKILVRGRRLDSRILDDLVWGGATDAPEIEVRRPAALSTEERWRDASGFLANRIDIVDARREGSRITVHTANGVTDHFEVDESSSGWRVQRTSENYPFRSFSANRNSSMLSLRATLAPGIDPMAPGMRGRLAFDLRADLVALG